MTEVQTKPAQNVWALSAAIAGVLGLALVSFGVWWGGFGCIYAVFAGLDGIKRARKTGNGMAYAVIGLVAGAIPILMLGLYYLTR